MNPVLEKIKKLLRLGKSSNSNEAALALSRAFELARKHAIDLESVNLDDEEIERSLLWIGARVAFERKLILNLVKHFFRVEIIVAPPNVAYIGRPTDIVIAHYVHDYLLRSLRLSLKGYQRTEKRKLSRTRRMNFIQGWVYAVGYKLTEAAEQLAVEDSRHALVKLDADPHVRAAVDHFYPNARQRKIKAARTNMSALEDGWHTGKHVNIHQPLAGPERAALPA